MTFVPSGKALVSWRRNSRAPAEVVKSAARVGWFEAAVAAVLDFPLAHTREAAETAITTSERVR